MKKILTSILTICFVFSLHIKAQTLQQHALNKPVPSKVRTKVVANTSFGKTTTCGVDTVEYPLLKATSSRGININAATSAAVAYQWYPSMQSITVSGFTFFAFLSNTAGILSQNVTVSIFNAGADSMPTGAALRSVTMSIDSVTGSGSLAALSKRVIFGTPVTIGSGNGYVLALENTSANPVVLLTNDWDVSDGNFEWCSSIKIGTNNVRSYGIVIGSVPFNSDFLMSPIVTYSITADYTSAPACFTIGSPLTLTNTSSAINFSRFYNIRRFNNAVATSFSWNFGNSTGGKAVDTSVIYSAAGPYNITLTDTLEAHYRYCVDTKVSSIGGRPATPTVGGAGNYCVGSNISLTCNTLAGATYNWTGPNGFTSNLQNPTLSSATVLMSGTYSVTVTLGICTSLPSSLVVNVIQLLLLLLP
jgi:PKD domain